MEPLPSIFSTVCKAVTRYSARARGYQLFLLSIRLCDRCSSCAG